MKRREFYQTLGNSNFFAVTGPTFSVYTETFETPPTYNIVMMRRHNRVIQEISQTGLTAIPNIYWRNEGDRLRWGNWLSKNKFVHTLSRDFSGTKHTTPFREQLSGLCEILSQLNRRLHVLLVGVGSKHGEIALQKLAELNCTCSILPKEPVHKAIGGKKTYNTKGENQMGGRS